MKIMRIAGITFVAGSALLAIGCGAADSPSSPTDPLASGATQNETAKTQQPQKLLHSVTIENDHTIGFYETPNGHTMIVEDSLTGQTPVLPKFMTLTTLSEVYRTIRPNLEVPAALREADERLAKVSNVTTMETPPPADELAEGAGSGPQLYTSAEQAAFKSTWCHDTGTTSVLNCIQGFSWANMGWKLGGLFDSKVLVGSEAAQAGTYTVTYWNNGNPQVQWNSLVSPGHTTRTTSGLWPNFYYYTSALQNAGANTQVSLSASECGEANERSCNPTCGGSGHCDPNHTDGCQIDGTTNGTCFYI